MPSERDQPYRVRVVLLFRPHPIFSENLRFNLRTDLAGALSSRLGGVAQWEIADPTAKPAADWTDFEKNLLKIGPGALDAPADLVDEKTHVFWIEWTDRGIRVRGRQRDGSTGFLSPLRESTLIDRSGLLKHLADAILHDFGFTGSFVPAGDTVLVDWKAGLKGTILADWLRPGDVLKVVQIRRDGAGHLRGSVADCDDVLLQASGEMKDGQSSCQLHRQYAGALPAPRGAILGYRCIRLATATAPLKLKLVDAKGQPRQGLQVRIKDTGFAENPQERDLATLQNGIFTSREPMRNIAFVRVDLGDRAVARIPLAVMGDEVVTRAVNLEPGAEARDRLVAQWNDWLRRVNDSRLVQNVCFRDLMAIEQRNKLPEAMELARKTLRIVDQDIVQLRGDALKLKGQYAELKLSIPGFTGAFDGKLLGLNDARRKLDDHIRQLEEVDRQQYSPAIVERRNKIKAMAARIDSTIQQANIEEALKLYEEAIAQAAADEPEAAKELAKKRDELRKNWEPQSPAHTAARLFIYDVWAKAQNYDDMKAKLPEARRAFETCRQLGDRYGLAKLNQLEPELESRLADDIQRLADGPKAESTIVRFDAMDAFKKDLIAFHKQVAEALRAQTAK